MIISPGQAVWLHVLHAPRDHVAHDWIRKRVRSWTGIRDGWDGIMAVPHGIGPMMEAVFQDGAGLIETR